MYCGGIALLDAYMNCSTTASCVATTIVTTSETKDVQILVDI